MRSIKYALSTILCLLLVSLVSLSAQEDRPLVIEKSSLPCVNKTFNVVAHIVKNDGDSLGIEQDSIAAVMAKVNALFAPICVDFNICETKIIENYQYDTVASYEWDELQVTYHQAKKINIFWVGEFDFENELCGVAALGGIGNLESGGILMKKGECLHEMAIAHELGRYFGVPWTFGEGEDRTEELVKSSNCEETGDLICDTPADPYVLEDDPEQYVDETNCRFTNQDQDDEGEWYVPHVGNIMSYYPDTCKCQFTDGQYRVMVDKYLASNPKMW